MEFQDRQEPGEDGMHSLSEINNSSSKMIRGEKREDLEKEISDVDKRDRREPIELMTPIIPEPTPAPAPEIVEELP